MNQYMCLHTTDWTDSIVFKDRNWDEFKEEMKRLYPNNPNVVKRFDFDLDKMEIIRADSIEEAFLKLCKRLGYETEDDIETALDWYTIIELP